MSYDPVRGARGQINRSGERLSVLQGMGGLRIEWLQRTGQNGFVSVSRSFQLPTTFGQFQYVLLSNWLNR